MENALHESLYGPPTFEARTTSGSGNRYEKHMHDKGGVIVTYDSQGRVLSMQNRYSPHQLSNFSEVNNHGTRTA